MGCMKAPLAHGELVTCPGCGGKDWEIRMGALDSRPPATVTCAGCLAMWWLESSRDPADPLRVRMREVPTAEVAPLPDHVPDWPPGDLEPPGGES
jgi:hypothetical protein